MDWLGYDDGLDLATAAEGFFQQVESFGYGEAGVGQAAVVGGSADLL